MPFKWVLLKTDILILLLIVLAGVLVVYASRRPTLARNWRQVFAFKRAQVAATVLACFALIGLLDSFHYQLVDPSSQHSEQVQYQPKIYSLLDAVLHPLGSVSERSYSAPLAIYSQAKETVTLADGTVKRIPVRLRHAGQHLNHPKQHGVDIALLVGKGLFAGVMLWLGLMTALYLFFRQLTAKGDGTNVSKNDQPPTSCDVLTGPIATIKHFKTPLCCVGLTLLIICIVTGTLLSLASHYHVLGTDKIGEDVLYQTIKSIRTGLVIGCLTTLVMLPLALVFGAMSGFFGGVVDDVIQYVYTTLSSIPGVLLIAAAVLTLDVQMSKHPELFGQHLARADARLLALCVILGVTSWTSLCRLIRAETLKLRELEYVQAARALGVSSWRIIASHIIPNVLHIVLIVIALDFSGLVLAEAVLSYVGVGVDPTSQSWGNMINQARLELAREPVVWWSLVGSFSFMFTLVLFANLFADAVRDGFDPRLN